MTLTATQDAAISAATVQLNAARVAAAYDAGDIVLSVAEECAVLADWARVFKRAGLLAAAADAREVAMQILDEAGY